MIYNVFNFELYQIRTSTQTWLSNDCGITNILNCKRQRKKALSAICCSVAWTAQLAWSWLVGISHQIVNKSYRQHHCYSCPSPTYALVALSPKRAHRHLPRTHTNTHIAIRPISNWVWCSRSLCEWKTKTAAPAEPTVHRQISLILSFTEHRSCCWYGIQIR